MLVMTRLIYPLSLMIATATARQLCLAEADSNAIGIVGCFLQVESSSIAPTYTKADDPSTTAEGSSKDTTPTGIKLAI